MDQQNAFLNQPAALRRPSTTRRTGGDLSHPDAGYWRGERHGIDPRPGDYDDGIPRIDYGN